MNLTGNRKFIVGMTGIICTSLLSGMVLYMGINDPVALIAAIGGNVTAVSTPFMFSNYGENKVKAAAGMNLPVPEID